MAFVCTKLLLYFDKNDNVIIKRGTVKFEMKLGLSQLVIGLSVFQNDQEIAEND